MRKINPENKLSFFDIIIATLFVFLVLVSYVPINSIITKLNPSTTSSSEATHTAQQQMGSLYDLSKTNSLAGALSTLSAIYTISTDVNNTTLTKNDDIAKTTIKLTQNFPTKGMTKVIIKVDLNDYLNSNSTSEIETILFFK